jgi:hypothetical protein
MKRWGFYACFVVAFVAVGNRILRLIPGRLGQNFVVGFLSEHVGPQRELTDVQIAKLCSFAWELGVPLGVAIVIIVVADCIIKAKLRKRPQQI